MPDLWRNRTRGAIRWINPALREISAENRPVSLAASTSAAAPCSASDTAVCTAGSPISNAADKAVNAGKVVKVHKCPICGKLTDNAKYRPFCSKRCADIDLFLVLPKDMLLKAKRRLTRKKGNNIPLLFIAPSLFCGMAPQLPRPHPGQD